MKTITFHLLGAGERNSTEQTKSIEEFCGLLTTNIQYFGMSRDAGKRFADGEIIFFHTGFAICKSPIQRLEHRGEVTKS